MKLTIVEKKLSWTAMHIDFVMCKNTKTTAVLRLHELTYSGLTYSRVKSEAVKRLPWLLPVSVLSSQPIQVFQASLRWGSYLPVQ